MAANCASHISALRELHLKCQILKSKVRFVNCISLQILSWHFNPIWVNAIRRCHEHISLCWTKSSGGSIIWLMPLEIRPGQSITTIGLLLRKPWSNLLWWRSSLSIWRRGSSLIEIDCCYVMNACPPLIFSPGKLPDKVFLSMTSYLSWCSTCNKISGNVSPISFAMLFQSQ